MRAVGCYIYCWPFYLPCLTRSKCFAFKIWRSYAEIGMKSYRSGIQFVRDYISTYSRLEEGSHLPNSITSIFGFLACTACLILKHAHNKQIQLTPATHNNGLTSALYGMKMALARLPVMPLRMKMIAMRCHPANFSRSRRTVIWKITDTRQWITLGAETDKGFTFKFPQLLRQHSSFPAIFASA